MRAQIYRVTPKRCELGFIAIAPRPRGGDWLEDEVSDWKSMGVHHVVSMLTPAEIVELDLKDEESTIQRAGLGYTGVAVEDRSLPDSRTTFLAEAERLSKLVERGENVLIHCRQGIGRSSLMAAAILVARGASPRDAWAAFSAGRGRPVPDTQEQREWFSA